MLSHKKVTVKKLNTITCKLTYVKNICSAHLVLITSVLTRPSVWYERGVLWANITHIKSHATALGFWLSNRYESDLSNEVL